MSPEPQLPADRKRQHLASKTREKPAGEEEPEIPGAERGIWIVSVVEVRVGVGHIFGSKNNGAKSENPFFA